MTIQPNYSHGLIPESNIDPKIARDSELNWNNILDKPATFPPSSHSHGGEAWVNPSWNQGWSASADTPLVFKKSSALNILFLAGAAKITVSSNYFNSMFTLPLEMRPINNRYITGILVKDGNLSTIPIRLTSGGSLFVFLTPGSNEVWLESPVHL